MCRDGGLRGSFAEYVELECYITIRMGRHSNPKTTVLKKDISLILSQVKVTLWYTVQSWCAGCVSDSSAARLFALSCFSSCSHGPCSHGLG